MSFLKIFLLCMPFLFAIVTHHAYCSNGLERTLDDILENVPPSIVKCFLQPLTGKKCEVRRCGVADSVKIWREAAHDLLTKSHLSAEVIKFEDLENQIDGMHFTCLLNSEIGMSSEPGVQNDSTLKVDITSVNLLVKKVQYPEISLQNTDEDTPHPVIVLQDKLDVTKIYLLAENKLVADAGNSKKGKANASDGAVIELTREVVEKMLGKITKSIARQISSEGRRVEVGKYPKPRNCYNTDTDDFDTGQREAASRFGDRDYMVKKNRRKSKS